MKLDLTIKDVDLCFVEVIPTLAELLGEGHPLTGREAQAIWWLLDSVASHLDDLMGGPDEIQEYRDDWGRVADCCEMIRTRINRKLGFEG